MCVMVVNVSLHGGHDIRWSNTDIPSLNVYYILILRELTYLLIAILT